MNLIFKKFCWEFNSENSQKISNIINKTKILVVYQDLYKIKI